MNSRSKTLAMATVMTGIQDFMATATAATMIAAIAVPSMRLRPVSTK